MKRKGTVSIVVPVYNTDKDLLRKCIKSIIQQSYPNIDIIIVDDGSNNETSSLCDEIAKNDSRIRVLHKSNGGLSSARNAGIDIAIGDEITFVDSDDYLDCEAIQILHETKVNSGCNIVCMDMVLVSDNGRIIKSKSSNSFNLKVIKSKDYLKGICEKKLSESVCDKLFSIDIFASRRFETGRLNEDFFFLSNLLLDSQYDIGLLDFAGYYYLKHSGTITADKQSFTSLKDAIKNSCQLADIAISRDANIYLSFVYSALFQARVLMSVLPKEKIGSEDWTYCRDVIDKFGQESNHCGLNNIDRLLLFGFYHFPNLTKRLYSFVK